MKWFAFSLNRQLLPQPSAKEETYMKMLSSSIVEFLFSKQPDSMKVAMNELLGSLEGIRRSRVIRRRRTAQGHTGTPVEALTCPHIEHDGEKKAFQGRSTHVGTASAPAMCSLAILQVLHATTAHDWWGIDSLMRPRYCLIRALSQSSLIPSIRQKCAW